MNEKFAAIFGYTLEKMLDKKIGKVGVGGHTEVAEIVLDTAVSRLHQGAQRTKGACALNQHTAVPSAKGTSYHLQPKDERILAAWLVR